MCRAVQELEGYDLVVNCTGLGAKLLFGDDAVHAVRSPGALPPRPATWVPCLSVRRSADARVRPPRPSLAHPPHAQPWHTDCLGSACGRRAAPRSRRAPGCPCAQIRGHVIRVRAPWVKANYFVNEDNYVLPNVDSVVRLSYPYPTLRPPARPGRRLPATGLNMALLGAVWCWSGRAGQAAAGRSC